MPPGTKLYETLGVSTNATQSEIKKGYFKMARKYHPDALKAELEEKAAKEGQAAADSDLEQREKMFKQVTEAYSVLGDTELRKKYDRLIFGSSSADETSSSFENQD